MVGFSAEESPFLLQNLCYNKQIDRRKYEIFILGH